jgi:hypothetical protein
LSSNGPAHIRPVYDGAGKGDQFTLENIGEMGIVDMKPTS